MHYGVTLFLFWLLFPAHVKADPHIYTLRFEESNIKPLRITAGKPAEMTLLPEDTQLFLKDNLIGHWDPAKKILSSQRPGNTEIILYHRRQIKVIPVSFSVNPHINNPQTTKLPDATNEDAITTWPQNSMKTEEKQAAGLITYTNQWHRQREPGTVSMTLTLKTDSHFASKSSMPLADVQVRIAGSLKDAKTNSFGQVTFSKLPPNGSFLVFVSDPQFRIKRSWHEVTTGSQRESKHDLPILLETDFELMESASKSAQISYKGSGCFFFQFPMDKHLKVDLLPPPHAQGLPAPSISIVRFNELHLPTTRQVKPDSPFCLLNLPAGTNVLQLRTNSGQSHRLLIHVEAGWHSAWKLYRHHGLPPMVNVNEKWQIAPDSNASVDIIGQAEPLSSHQSTPITILSTQPRAPVLSYGDSYEPALQQLDLTTHQPVFLISRGWLTQELMTNSVTGQAADASAVMTLTLHQNEDPAAQIILWGPAGLVHPTTKGVLGDTGLAYTLFYNIAPGNYAAIKQGIDGRWVSATTVLAVKNTTSHVYVDGYPELQRGDPH